MTESRIIPVWFFVGIILFIYGILIFITGLSELSNPPKTVLAHLHAPVWWGAFLGIVGGIYTFLFWPRKQ